MNPLVIIVAAALMAVACNNPDTRAPAGSTSPAGSMAGSGPGVAMPMHGTTGPSGTMGSGPSAAMPMHQGTSAAETEITAAVQKGINADGPLAKTGKDVRVVTAGTRVTLSGPVSSGLAREVIGDIAKRTAGVTEVDNRIEVVN
jgi:osmotically-inducible protein OsmY